MVHLVSDNLQVKDQLELICDVILSCGGFLHEDLTIRCRDGGLTMEAAERISNRIKLIQVPRDLLLPLEDDTLALKGDEIFIKNLSGKMSPERIKLLEAMVAIYNLTDKIADHRQTATSALYYKDPALLKRLTGEDFVGRCAEWDKTDFYLASFLASRFLSFKIDSQDDAPNKVLMPLVDFFNHHPLAAGFGNRPEGLAVSKFTTPDTGPECFVNYGRFDDFRALTGYGYVETKSRVVVSLPLLVNLPKGNVIKVNARYSTRHQIKKVPEEIKDIPTYIPAFGLSEDRTQLTLSSIRIPSQQAPRALRRTLRFVISKMSVGMLQDDLMTCVDMAERQIIDHNKAYYSDLIQDMGKYAVMPDTEHIIRNIQAMATSQLGKLNTYSFERARS